LGVILRNRTRSKARDEKKTLALSALGTQRGFKERKHGGFSKIMRCVVERKGFQRRKELQFAGLKCAIAGLDTVLEVV